MFGGLLIFRALKTLRKLTVWDYALRGLTHPKTLRNVAVCCDRIVLGTPSSAANRRRPENLRKAPPDRSACRRCLIAHGIMPPTTLAGHVAHCGRIDERTVRAF